MQLKKNMKKYVTNMNSELPNWPKPAQPAQTSPNRPKPAQTSQNRLKFHIMFYKFFITLMSSPRDFIYNGFLVIGYYYLLESHCCKVSKVGITSKYPLHCSPFRVEILVILTFLIAGLFKNII